MRFVGLFGIIFLGINSLHVTELTTFFVINLTIFFFNVFSPLTLKLDIILVFPWAQQLTNIFKSQKSLIKLVILAPLIEQNIEDNNTRKELERIERKREDTTFFIISSNHNSQYIRRD